MARRKREIANTPLDPTAPHASVTIDGKEYRLCFDFAALAEARAYFRKQGRNDVNLLRALMSVDADSVWIVFPCAIHKFHPEISYEDAQAMLTIPVAFVVADAIIQAWNLSVPEPKEAPPANPPQA